MYEYVPTSELKIVKAQIDEIIKKLQKLLKSEGITFRPDIVGSAQKYLVTRLTGDNKGFDFDYNFCLQKNTKKLNEKQLRELFIKSLNTILKTTRYKNPENNTSVITIKLVDQENSLIKHSCDFAIIKEHVSRRETYQDILIFDKNTGNYIWNKKALVKVQPYKIADIVSNGIWGEVREEYLKLKNKKQKGSVKKSFALYYEAVNNVYNNYDWD